jgi:hypothetical protein
VVTEPDAWSGRSGPSRHFRAKRPSRHRARGTGTTAALVAAILGGIGLVVSLAGLAIQVLPRQFSAAQQRQIMAWEVSERWRTLPAGDIFPASVHYQLPASVVDDIIGVSLEAPRVGIASQSACADGTDPAAARALDRHGCQALLRATYTDESATYVMTVGVAVMTSAAQASAAQTALAQSGGNTQPRPGVRTMALNGTPASQFGAAQRQLSGSFSAGPYMIMYTAGYADGRPRLPMSDDPYAQNEMTSAVLGVAQAVAARLAAPPPMPHCPGMPEC